MHVSQRVQGLQRDIAHYDREIEQEKEKIRVLNAEWAYLNNPERLEALATGGYDLKMPQTEALVSNPAGVANIFTSDDSNTLSSISPASGAVSGTYLPKEKDLSMHPQTIHSQNVQTSGGHL